MTSEPTLEESQSEPERRSDPQGEPAAAGDRRQGRAGAAAAYAAAHAAARHTDGASELDSDGSVEADSSVPPGGDEDAEILAAVNGADAADGGGQPAESQEQVLAHNLDELVAKAEKAQEYLSLAQRTQADFENYRKRAARDAALSQERGITRLAKELLPAIDNLDRALAAAVTYSESLRAADHASGGSDPADDAGSRAGNAAASAAENQLVSGLRLVHAEVLAALARVGIEPFSPVGEQFDPQHHEAVAQQPFDGQAPGTVVEVYQQGFRFGESVLRPARVLVAA
jgi:molecular chaperone GrpE